MKSVAPVFMYNDKLIWNGFFESNFGNKTKTIEIYHQHFEVVKNTIPSKNLLIMEIQKGWKPICDFLGYPVPNIPFPKANQRKEFNKKMDKLLIDGKFEL